MLKVCIHTSSITFCVLGEFCVDKLPFPVVQRPAVRCFLHVRLVLLGRSRNVRGGGMYKCTAIYGDHKELHP